MDRTDSDTVLKSPAQELKLINEEKSRESKEQSSEFELKGSSED